MGRKSGLLLPAISPVSKRANKCAEQADAELSGFEGRSRAPKRRNSYEDGRGSIDTTVITGAAVAFESLVSEIEELLQKGGADAIRTLKRGESTFERVPPRGVRRYRIPLPERPKEIVVSVSCSTGDSPAMWASTSDVHPDAHHHEFAGKEDQIVYKHIITPSSADYDANVDRRRVAPSCRDLFVTVETAGECHFDISVSFRDVTIVLSRKELGAQIAKMKHSWVTRVEELRKEPEAREEFDDHIIELRKAAAERKKGVGNGYSFVQQNVFLAKEYTPRSKAFQLHKKALQNVAHQEEVSARRGDRSCGVVGSKTSRRLRHFGATLCHAALEASETPAITDA